MTIDDYLKPRKEITGNMDNKHLLEVNGFCPLCGKILIGNKKNQKNNTVVYKKYEIAHIFPNSPSEDEKKLLKDVKLLGNNCEDFENKIALCKDCHKKYDTKKTIDEYEKLFDIKTNFIQRANIIDDVNKQEINEYIKEILLILKNADNSPIELTNKAIQLKNKIQKDQSLLVLKVQMNVTYFYNFIFETIKAQDSSIEFDIIASQIKAAFLTINKNTSNQSEIFYSLCDWLSRKCPGYPLGAYEAIISYFIQNCEVFYEISK